MLEAFRPLTAAVRGDNIEMVKFLLESGADPNLKDTGLAMPPAGTALENASESGNVEMAKLLLERGADINLKGYWPPLRTALSHGNAEMVGFLLSQGAKWESVWLWQAIASGRPEILRQMIAVGADVNVRSEDGGTPLIYAAGHSDPEYTKLLLAAGAKVNAQSHVRKETPLTRAAKAGYLEIVEILLAAGADSSMPGPRGKTAEQIARMFGRKDVAKFLRDKANQKQTHPSIKSTGAERGLHRRWEFPKQVGGS
jgi:ankyrin repeat protein